jgi:predicted anti-sigma-YlaC factor YlaD
VERVTAAVCERVRAFVSLELDDELSELERTVLEAHTEDCDACREFRASVAAYTHALRSRAPEAPGRSFWIPRPRRRLAPFSMTAAAAAAVAVFVGGLVTVLSSAEPSRSPRVGVTNPTPGQRVLPGPALKPSPYPQRTPGSRMRVV